MEVELGHLTVHSVYSLGEAVRCVSILRGYTGTTPDRLQAYEADRVWGRLIRLATRQETWHDLIQRKIDEAQRS